MLNIPKSAICQNYTRPHRFLQYPLEYLARFSIALANEFAAIHTKSASADWQGVGQKSTQVNFVCVDAVLTAVANGAKSKITDFCFVMKRSPNQNKNSKLKTQNFSHSNLFSQLKT
jgi:hypothetical protein